MVLKCEIFYEKIWYVYTEYISKDIKLAFWTPEFALESGHYFIDTRYFRFESPADLEIEGAIFGSFTCQDMNMRRTLCWYGQDVKPTEIVQHPFFSDI